MRPSVWGWLVGCASMLALPTHAEPLDGRLFDLGAELEAPAENAPEALQQLAPWLGDWDLELVIHRPGNDSLRSTGIAQVTYLNRGHGLMERTRIADFDGQGHSMATLAMVALDGSGVWTLGEGNSWTETISLWSGAASDGGLVLHDAQRPGGGTSLVLARRTYASPTKDRRTMQLEVSTDLGATWTLSAERTYRRRPPSEGFFPVRADYGLPAPGRPAEAAEFDFLIGEFQATHRVAQPQGVLRWRSNASAVHVLDGHGILEFDWHEMDPSLPNAATSILRLYNRAMRRWESLFLSNRGNVPLLFGGVREGERIVLHPFAAQTGAAPLSQWIFFDKRPNAYRWKGLTSTDRGRTYQVGWAIDFVRKGVEPASVRGREEVRTSTADGVEIFGDLYRAKAPAASTVLLFHQAGGDARGEYGRTAHRLVEEGFEVFAWDSRSGGDRFGSPNRTVNALGAVAIPTYCAAYPDLQAALQYAFLEGSGGPIFALGSSYSAALVVRLAAEHGNLLAGAVAFSPASGQMEGGDGETCGVETWLPRVESTPLLVLRPESEVGYPGVAAQSELFAAHGVELRVVAEAPHGASMLDSEYTEGEVEPTWERLLAFFADPHAAAGPGERGEAN